MNSERAEELGQYWAVGKRKGIETSVRSDARA